MAAPRALVPVLLLAGIASGCSEDASPVLWVLDRPTPPTLDEVEYQPATLGEVAARPDHYREQGVSLVCRYHGQSQVFTPAYTDYTSAGFLNFSAWAPDAPIWEPEGFAADLPFFYVDRRRKDVIEQLQAVRPFDRIEVRACVTAVFAGRPYLRVDRIRRRGGPRVTREGLRGIHDAVVASRQGRWKDGIAFARKALGGDLPPGAEPVLRKALGHCLLESGSSREALSELSAAAAALPGDADVLKWEGRAARAQAQMGSGRHAEAVRFLEEAQAKAPEDPEIPLLLAEAHLAARSPAEALVAAERAVALAPRSAEAHHELAALLAGQDQLDGAVRSYRQAVALEPARWRAWSALARVQIRKGDLEGAVASFEQAFAHGGSEVPADDHYLSGRSCQSLGRTAPARKAFQTALARPGPWGGAADARSALGELALGEKDFKTAAAEYEAALSLRPRDAEFLACLGVARLKGGEFAAAREAFEKALEAGVGRPGLVGEELTRACLAAGDLKDAAKAIARACDREETAPRRFLQGSIARLMARPKDAEKAFGRAAALDPKDVHAHLNRAIVLIELEKYDGAFEALGAGEKVEPENPFLMTVRAYGMLRQGKDAAGALPLAEKAFALIPENPDAKHGFGWALLAAGRAEEALPLLQDAARSGDVPEVSFHLAQALLAAGRPEEARPVLETLSRQDHPFARPARKLLKGLPKAQPAPDPPKPVPAS